MCVQHVLLYYIIIKIIEWSYGRVVTQRSIDKIGVYYCKNSN